MVILIGTFLHMVNGDIITEMLIGTFLHMGNGNIIMGILIGTFLHMVISLRECSLVRYCTW